MLSNTAINIPKKIFKKYLDKHLKKFTNIKIDNKAIITLSIITSQLITEIIEPFTELINNDSISYKDFKKLLNEDIELKFISEKINYFTGSTEIDEESIKYSTDLTDYIKGYKNEIFGNKPIKLQKKFIKGVNNFIWLIIYNILNNISNSINVLYYKYNTNFHNHIYTIDQKDILYGIDSLLLFTIPYDAIKNNILLRVGKTLK